jgi:hypothetical protein
MHVWRYPRKQNSIQIGSRYHTTGHDPVGKSRYMEKKTFTDPVTGKFIQKPDSRRADYMQHGFEIVPNKEPTRKGDNIR